LGRRFRIRGKKTNEKEEKERLLGNTEIKREEKWSREEGS